MQKKVIALAIAGLVSGAAFAQSNVTVYGVIDAFTGIANADNAAGNQKQTVVNAGGIASSRLGFMGEEALGNGLKSVFKLELGSLSTDASTNNIGNTRQAYVGLTSDKFGSVLAGRQQALAWNWAIKYDALGASNAFSPMASLNCGASGSGQTRFLFTGCGIGRLSNSISYISPKFAGVTVRGDWAAGEQVTGTNGATGVNKAQNYYALGFDYDQGPLAIGGGFAQAQNLGGTLNNASEAKIGDWALAGKYNFGVVTPFLSYQESKWTPAAGNSIKSKLWQLGVNVPVGAAGTIRANFVDFKDDAANAVKAKGWAINYNHALSKRTTAYVGYQSINNGTYAAFGTINAVSGVAPSADKNASFYGVGVSHSF